MDAFLSFSIWVLRDALMLSGTGTLSSFSRKVLVESKIVFKLLGVQISEVVLDLSKEMQLVI